MAFLVFFLVGDHCISVITVELTVNSLQEHNLFKVMRGRFAINGVLSGEQARKMATEWATRVNAITIWPKLPMVLQQRNILSNKAYQRILTEYYHSEGINEVRDLLKAYVAEASEKDGHWTWRSEQPSTWLQPSPEDVPPVQPMHQVCVCTSMCLVILALLQIGLKLC